MRVLTKRFILVAFVVVLGVCCGFFAASGFSGDFAKADSSALEAEFTNNGQFEIKTSAWNDAYEFIDGTSVGGVGAVLKVTRTAGTGTSAFKLDFSSSGILASKVDSIVVRVKADNFTLGTDEFRTDKNAGSSWVNYGKKDDLSVWHDYTLNATTMAQLTNDDGTLGSTNIAIRAYTANLVMYVDSVTVNLQVDYEAMFTGGQFEVKNTAWGGTHEFIDGTTVGGTGAVLKAGVLAGTAGFRLDLSSTGLKADDVESIVVRVKADNFTLGTDEFRTSKLSGADFVNYGKTDDLSVWHDYTLSAATMAQLTNNDGTLDSTDIVIRAYTSGLIVYFDSVTINVKVDYEAMFTGGQFEVGQTDWGGAYEFIDGTTVGGTGAVLKAGVHTGTAGFKLDLSSTGLKRDAVESIVVRVKADNFVVGTDYFKTAINTGKNYHDYLNNDLRDWFEYTLDATSMAQLTNQDETLGSIDIVIRAKSSNDVIAYFDSVTINVKVDYEAMFTGGQFEVGQTDWGGAYEFIDGTTVGGTGAVLKAGVHAGTAGFKLDLSSTGLTTGDVESIVVRVKADNFVVDTDYFKTAKDSGHNYHDYEGDDLRDWFDYTLDATSMAQLANQDGTLGDIDIVIRAKSSNDVIAYFDSVIINEKVILTPTVVCQGIANDVNNNIYEENTKTYRTLLKYDINLGTSSNQTNVVLTTGQGIKLNGVALSAISGASINYGHGKTYIQIRIPASYQDALEGEVVLEVMEGTQFESQILDYSKFVLRNGQWAPYKEPEPIEFAIIFRNNDGAEIYEGKNGLLLSYSEYLSNVSNEVNGGMRDDNLVGEEIGGKIKLDNTPLSDIDGAEIIYYGTSLLWIYAPNMTSYKELTVEQTEFLVAILPESHFAFFDGEWAESYKITSVINGVERISYCKKNGKPVLSEKYYQEVFKEEELLIKLVSFKVGNKVYGADESYAVTSDTSATVTVVGYETSFGASIRLKTPTGIRFETKIDKEDYDYLIGLYGEENVEVGTYIVRKDYLGYADYKEYFADSENTYVKVVNRPDDESVDAYYFYNTDTAEADGFYLYYGSLVNIKPFNLSEDFFGVGYIRITDGAKVYTIYGGDALEDHIRSIYEVSKRAYKDYADGTNAKAALESYMDGVVSLIGGAQGLEIENTVDGYVSPYTINYSGLTGTYTISGASEIKTVLFGGSQKSESSDYIGVNGALYRLINYTVSSAAAFSTVSFRLSPMTAASDLVDFTVEIPSDRELKILQLTDTQIIDSSQMRTSNRLLGSMITDWARENIDKNCFNYIAQLVENENPDLIILTGDIIYGEFDDSGVIWTRIVEFMDSLGIPWAPIFGNHDNESAKGVDWQCAQLEAAKNCLFKRGNLTGNGNYSIGLVDANGKIRRVIYMLDSNGCYDSNNQLIKAAQLYPDQIEWFKNVSAAIDAAYGETVPAFACYHIPSSDFQTAYVNKYGYAADISSFNLDNAGIDGDFGQKGEKVSMFDIAMASDLKAANVDGVFSGHDHTNNYSILYDGIRYTYGTKTGTYDMYNASVLGGTLISVEADGYFEVSPKYLNKTEMENRLSASFTVTITSDLHFDEQDYGSFHCTQSEAKFKQIVSETQSSRFYINLGDTVNSLPNARLNNMYNAIGTMKEVGLNVYNSQGVGYIEGNKMIYNLSGNHEVAYVSKSTLKDYIPYVDGVGSVAVLKSGDVMFVIVDALFDRATGKEDAETMFNSKTFTIPATVRDWLTAEVENQMDGSVKGIVWLSHIALQDIDDTKYDLLGALKEYGLPMAVFEGHTHVENYTELTDSVTGKVYCKVYTLPAVTVGDTYPYYNVTFVNGEVWCVDKHTTQVIGSN